MQPRPYTAPKVAFPEQFPHSSQLHTPMDRIKDLHLKLLSDDISQSDFLSSAASCPSSSADEALALSAALISFLSFCKPYQFSFPIQFSRIFSELIQNQNEVVSRSCLPMLFLISTTPQYEPFLTTLSSQFSKWTPRAQELMLAFSFNFQAERMANWGVFLSDAYEAVSSSDELLSSTASQFIQWMRPSSKDSQSSARSAPSPEIANKKEQIGSEIAITERKIATAQRSPKADESEEQRPKKPEPRTLPLPKKRIGPPIDVSVDQMKNPDWEKQKEAVECLQSAFNEDPSKIEDASAKIWLNLIDLIESHRTLLSSSSLTLATSLINAFPVQLSAHTPQFIVSCFNICCSSHIFLADGADSILKGISEKVPKSRTFQPLLLGLKHKNSIARGKAAECLLHVIQAGQLVDKEISSLVQGLAPLLRDGRAQTRDASREDLRALSNDPRFNAIAASVFHSDSDFAEIKRAVC